MNIKWDKVGWVLLFLGIVYIVIFTIIGNFLNPYGVFDPEMLSKYGGFIGGTAGIIFSTIGYFLVYEALKQNKTTQFENSFYTLFNSFQEYRTKYIALEYKGELKYGIEFFETLFIKQFEKENKTLAQQNETVVKSQLCVQRSVLSQYFGIINALLKKVYESELPKKNKAFYIDFINCVLNGQEKFLIKKLDLCLNINDYQFINKFRIEDLK